MNPKISDNAANDRPLLVGIAVWAFLYALACGLGWTQSNPSAVDHSVEIAPQSPHLWSVLPFCLLLGAIAVLPLIGHFAHWWESNMHKAFVAGLLALLTLLYLAILHPHGSPGFALRSLEHTILRDYLPFIILLFTLYTICGGIRIAGDLPAHAMTNTSFILIGAVLASFIGTTGAAMLLIRPLLETNRERKHVAHTAVFFIFGVCNCGGLLLPLGDPPLFLGYLNGVDFLWTTRLWPSWLFVNGSLLAIYFAWDHLLAYPSEAAHDLARDEARVHRLRITGLLPNALLLAGVVLSVGLLDSAKLFPGTNWYPWIYLREVVQLLLVAASLLFGHHSIRSDNNFNYGAILEVAVLFAGIFICMQPALQILEVRGAELGVDSPAELYWASGLLSSMLDNAPTYLVFFQTAKSFPNDAPTAAPIAEMLLKAISLGAVFGGALTYIGNGPNFMVKSIAEQSGVQMPSFFGYTLYSIAILLPVLALNAWLFL